MKFYRYSLEIRQKAYQVRMGKIRCFVSRDKTGKKNFFLVHFAIVENEKALRCSAGHPIANQSGEATQQIIHRGWIDDNTSE